MKLATFVAQDQERFGLILPHPATGELWVFDPQVSEDRLHFYASRQTSPFLNSRPRFLEKQPWPKIQIK